jgi:hypothetical protein
MMRTNTCRLKMKRFLFRLGLHQLLKPDFAGRHVDDGSIRALDCETTMMLVALYFIVGA